MQTVSCDSCGVELQTPYTSVETPEGWTRLTKRWIGKGDVPWAESLDFCPKCVKEGTR